MTVGHPWALALLIPLIAAAVFSLRGRGHSRASMSLLLAIRLLLGTLMALAVADVSIRLPSPRRQVIFLIDTSPSFADRSTSAETLAHERMNSLNRDDVVTLLHFDGTVTSDQKQIALPSVDATDIESALDAASAAIPPRTPGAVFLLTDGIETRGDASAAAMRLAARGIPVYIPRPGPSAAEDARVAEFTAPRFVARDTSVRLSCRIDATRDMGAAVELLRDGIVIHRGMHSVPTTFTHVDTPPSEGLHVYTARVAAEGDSFAQNNELSVPVVVQAAPLVLYLTGYEGATPIERLLQSQPAFRYRRITAEQLTPQLLADASVVVLDNFSAARLGAKSVELAAFVRDAGGGLLMLGGPESFGAGGYIDTAIDEVLPVRCDPRDADKKPLDLVVLLDASGSMGESGGEKMDIARTSTSRMLACLAPKDRAAVVAFRMEPQVVVPLAPVGDSGALARTLAGISPTGGTNIFPALNRALALLADSKAPLKHVILLSDGKSRPGDGAAIAARYRAAAVTLSTVATGADADHALLAQFSAATGGRAYDAARMTDVANIFLDDLRRIDGPLVRRGSLLLQRRGPGDSALLPVIAACNRVRLRDGAGLEWYHTVEGQDEPVLAHGRAGLGKTAAFTASFEPSWVGGLLATTQWQSTLANTLRLVHRWEPTRDYALDIRREGGDFDVTVIAGDNAPALTTAQVRLSTHDGRSAVVPIERASARTYHGAAETALTGVASAALVARAGDSDYVLATSYVPTAYAREFASLIPRLDLLERIANITGGAVVDNLDAFRAAGGRAPRESRDATPWLLAAALALFLVELTGRAAGRF